MIQLSLFDEGPSFTDRSTKDVTFQGKMNLPIHRWYRLTPSFSPKLANDLADHFCLTEQDLVLDPFSGVGTVPLCMKYRGISAWSVEINPYLQFVGSIKTRTYSDVSAAEREFDRFFSQYKAALSEVPFQESPDKYLERNEDFIPKISNVGRWWSKGNLAQLVCLRQVVGDFEADTKTHFDLIRMAVLAILIPVSNAKHNHVSLSFAASPLKTVSVLDALRLKLNEILDDLCSVQSLPDASVTVYAGNSKKLSKILPTDRQPTAVITSPPYPNRFSYARETRPHLFFFEFVTQAKEVGQLETDAIGGTWGKATSVLSNGIEPCHDVVATELNPYLPDIQEGGNLMAYYVIKYFNDIYTHASELARVCHDSVRLAYVIGNSKFYENHLPSDEILAAIFRHHGFKLDSIERMRRRQSKKDLYESVVFLSR